MKRPEKSIWEKTSIYDTIDLYAKKIPAISLLEDLADIFAKKKIFL